MQIPWFPASARSRWRRRGNLACLLRQRMNDLGGFDGAYGTSKLNLRECLGESTLARSRLASLLPR